jgi:beta-1,4-N-acetylglucosaminyltransferase
MVSAQSIESAQTPVERPSRERDFRSKILIVFGEGGHCEQMRRLIAILGLPASDCIAIVDKNGISNGVAAKELVVPPLRPKISSSLNVIWSSIAIVTHLATTIRLFLSSDRIGAIVSTGPGVAIVPSIFYRLCGRRVIFLETWSRFESASFTGKVMVRVASDFYVQNEELLLQYTSAIYCGRL